MDLAARISLAWSRKYKTKAAFAAAAGISKQYLNSLLKGDRTNPGSDVERGLASALGIDRAALISDSDAAFLAALDHDPTVPDPEPTEERVADEHRGGRVRSLPIDTFLQVDGLVDGSLAIDVITRPTGKSGATLKRRHAQRSDRKAKAQHVEIEGVPQGCELVRAEATFELRDEEPAQVIPRGFLLVVDRARRAEPGQLVLAVKNVNQRETEELPEVRLFRYHKVGAGWGLAAVDGSGRTFGSGDGWEVVAAVLWWRSPP